MKRKKVKKPLRPGRGGGENEPIGPGGRGRPPAKRMNPKTKS